MNDLFVHVDTLHYNNDSVVIFEAKSKYVFANYLVRLMEYRTWKLYNKGNKKLFDSNEWFKWYEMITGGLSYGDQHWGIYFNYDLLYDFYKKYWNQLNIFEKELLELFAKEKLIILNKKGFRKKANSTFHLICINSETMEEEKIKRKIIVNHEISHFFYCIDSKYKNLVLRSYKNLSTKYKKRVEYNLDSYGYKLYFPDEWSASIVSGEKWFYRSTKNIDQKTINIINKVKTEFEKRLKNSNHNLDKLLKN